jgi:hypothetical protein
MNKGAGAVLIAVVMGDKRPEIIRADYGFNPSYQNIADRYSFAIYTYDDNLKKYTVVRDPGPLGIFANNDRGATSIKAADFDNDGDLDLALAIEAAQAGGASTDLTEKAIDYYRDIEKKGFGNRDFGYVYQYIYKNKKL